MFYLGMVSVCVCMIMVYLHVLTCTIYPIIFIPKNVN